MGVNDTIGILLSGRHIVNTISFVIVIPFTQFSDTVNLIL